MRNCMRNRSTWLFQWEADMTTETSSLDTRYAMRLGAIMAIVGGIVFMIGNMLHARADGIEIYQNQIQAVAESDIWIVDHLTLGIGMLLLSVDCYFLAVLSWAVDHRYG